MQDTITKVLGLVTEYNPLSVAPGGLTLAKNAVVIRDDVIESRRGNRVYGSVLAAPSQFHRYLNAVIAHDSTNLEYDNGSGTFTPYSGSYSAPSGYKMQSERAKSNLYLTTSTGIKVIQDVAGNSARAAGCPQALNPAYALNAASTGFLATASQVAYRVLISRTDLNSNTITGYPSQRLWVTNSSGVSKNIDIDCYIPSNTVAGDTLQVYRTNQFTGTSTDLAGDEMLLCYQTAITSGQVSAGKVSFTDSIIDALLGATLYTSPSQEGIAQANSDPPLAKSLALYKSFMLYFNTVTKHRLYFTIVGVTSMNTKTVVIAGVTYTFSTSGEDTTTGTALVGTSSVTAVDIETTARSLVNVINRYASNTRVYAYYLSGPNDPPGQILIQERSVGGSSFSIVPDATIQIDFSYVTNTSSNESFKNRCYFAKTDQPEAVPLLNYLPVGPANAEGFRVIALRDSAIFITDAGIYRLTGETPSSFSVVPLDLTVLCKAKDSIVTLGNQVYMLSNQGIVQISDSAVQVISREIEDQIKPLLSFSNLSTYTSAVSYESDRLFLLSTMEVSTDTEPTQTFCYNIFTRAWTLWDFGMVAGIVEPSTDKLYFALSGESSVYIERKSYSDADYADPDTAITIISVLADQVVFTCSGATPEAGWALSQAGTSIVIDSVDDASGTTFTVTMLTTPPISWGAGAGVVYPPTGFELEWNAWHAGQPGLLKAVRQYEILTDQLSGQNSTTSLIATFKTDMDGNQETTEIDSAAYHWGSSPWGEFPWGGVDDTNAYPTWVPFNKTYCRLMKVGVRQRNAIEKASIAGYSLTYDLISEKVST